MILECKAKRFGIRYAKRRPVKTPVCLLELKFFHRTTICPISVSGVSRDEVCKRLKEIDSSLPETALEGSDCYRNEIAIFSDKKIF